MNETLNLNVDSQDLSGCLKKIEDIGQNRYLNICTGHETIVPWGTMDWVGGSVVSILVVVLVVSIVAAAHVLSKLIRDSY